MASCRLCLEKGEDLVREAEINFKGLTLKARGTWPPSFAKAVPIEKSKERVIMLWPPDQTQFRNHNLFSHFLDSKEEVKTVSHPPEKL